MAAFRTSRTTMCCTWQRKTTKRYRLEQGKPLYWRIARRFPSRGCQCRDNTSASDFTINDLVNHEHPASLYLVVPPSDKIRLRPLIRLIFTMIVNRLTERMDFEGAEQKRNRYRLLFMVDEFPSLKRMEVFADALSYMAGYGLKAYLITQDTGRKPRARSNRPCATSSRTSGLGSPSPRWRT
jgi:hypothetical protein